MEITIHRGAAEIGGSVVELTAQGNSILLDVGAPLSTESHTVALSDLTPDAVFISHPHQDHFGLVEELDRNVPVYMGGTGRNLADAARIFRGEELLANNFKPLSPGTPVQVGAFTVTPILVDHSAVDAFAFLVEAEGKRLIYSGDFRAHGRKSLLFERMVENPPVDIDVLLMEGTMMERGNREFPDESAVEEKIVEVIREQENICFMICSSQNIDRVVSTFRACRKTDKIMVVDLYTAWVLEKMKEISNHVPHLAWNEVQMYADYGFDNVIKENPEYFGDFRTEAYKHRVSKEALLAEPGRYVMLCRMSKAPIISKYRSIQHPVNVIYSQWKGYLNAPASQYRHADAVSRYPDDPEVNFVYTHTSGHATVDDLQRFAGAVNARHLIPIHTEYPEKFTERFANVTPVEDGEVYVIPEG